jgi:hypothetical protein
MNKFKYVTLPKSAGFGHSKYGKAIEVYLTSKVDYCLGFIHHCGKKWIVPFEDDYEFFPTRKAASEHLLYVDTWGRKYD